MSRTIDGKNRQQMRKWQRVIEAEWQTCPDEEYAMHLFGRLAHKRVNWWTHLGSVALGLWPMYICLLPWISLITHWLSEYTTWDDVTDRFWACILLNIPISLIASMLLMRSLRSWGSIDKVRRTTHHSAAMLTLAFTLGYMPVFLGITGKEAIILYGTYWPYTRLSMSLLSPLAQHVETLGEAIGLVGALGVGMAALFSRPKQPSWAQVQQALGALGGAGFAEVLCQLEAALKQDQPVDVLLANLDSHLWTERLVARRALVCRGGDAMAQIEQMTRPKRHEDWLVRLLRGPRIEERSWLLQAVAHETCERLVHRLPFLLCSRCIARCVAHTVRVSWWRRVRFYGCRVCKQSREFIEHAGEVVAVLDAHWNEERRQTDGVLGVNWHKRRTIFDFDKVEILQATDEDVERFCVQVANDSDPYRRKRYRKIPVTIASSCTLSENSLRVLRSSFGKVTTRS